MKRVSKEEFIERANEVHGNKYDYSHVEFVNMSTKVCIICPKHGEFWQEPRKHVSQKQQCPKCSTLMVHEKQKYTKEIFIKKAKEIHGDKYDYSQVKYINSQTKVCIICPIHGKFYQKPNTHLQGRGCNLCSKPIHDKNSFIEKAKEVHNDKYDYSKVDYLGTHTKVCIICPIHGEFWQTPNDHLRGHGCSECSGIAKLDDKKFIERAMKVHGNKYDYSKVKYYGSDEKVCIICHEHGEFWQTPHSHLHGGGCYKCNYDVYDTKSFILKAQNVHNNKYDYGKVQYTNTEEKVCIICPKHGEFWQTPHSHLRGGGCPRCNSSKMENEISTLLIANKISFLHNKRYKTIENLQLDFYLPKYNIAIECQGGQHFFRFGFEKDDNGLKYRQNNDARKRKLCEENGIRLLYYSNLGIKYPYKVYEDLQELIENIKT